MPGKGFHSLLFRLPRRKRYAGTIGFKIYFCTDGGRYFLDQTETTQLKMSCSSYWNHFWNEVTSTVRAARVIGLCEATEKRPAPLGAQHHVSECQSTEQDGRRTPRQRVWETHVNVRPNCRHDEAANSCFPGHRIAAAKRQCVWGCVSSNTTRSLRTHGGKNVPNPIFRPASRMGTLRNEVNPIHRYVLQTRQTGAQATALV